MVISSSSDKFGKMEQENERLRNEIKQLRQQPCKI